MFVAPSGAQAASHVVVVSPGHSIDKAVRSMRRGGVVVLLAGHYHQRVHLVGVHAVTVRPARGAHVVLDGAGLRAPSGDITAMVTVRDSTDVTVEGLDITGYRTSRLGVVVAGIYVHGHDTGVYLRRNHVHDLGNYNGTLGSFDINAHGIAAYGDDPRAPIHDLRISGNTVDHLHLGASETVVVNGNVDGWTINHNDIHDDNNIGIDAIGFEPTLGGAHRYTQANRARHGTIEYNTVRRIRSRGNPAYWQDGWCNCADGIYVDGGTRIRIAHNVVGGSDIGIEVAAENARGSADHVLVTRNRITRSLYTGIATGGYCNGAKVCGDVQTGTSHDNRFTYNWLRGNNQLDDGSPELLVQYHTWDDLFAHNTIIATDSAHVVYGTQPGATSNGHAHRDRSDHNVFAAVGVGAPRAQFAWYGHVYTGFGAYRRATGQDAHSSFR